MSTVRAPSPAEMFDPAPLERCATCGRPLGPGSASLWFCSIRTWSPHGDETWSPCQLTWYASRTTFPAAVDPQLALTVLAGQ
jgi:hypothetical protein